jgi:hypothetical protein
MMAARSGAAILYLFSDANGLEAAFPHIVSDAYLAIAIANPRRQSPGLS